MNAAPRRPLRILFVFRAPVGGLFRNVFDVVTGLAERGHQIGIFCDSSTGGVRGEKLLADLAPKLALGLHRMPMRRNPHPSDIPALFRIFRLLRDLKVDVVQGEGAKGGLYARLEGVLHPNSGPIRCYTPHGGSLNYHPGSLKHRVFMGIERLLELGTDLFLFESRFVLDRFTEFVCPTRRPTVVALNGLYPQEYEPCLPLPDACDFLYVGEFREAKGLDTLIDAFTLLGERGVRPSIQLVGSGPSEQALRALVAKRGLESQFNWRGVTPAREAFALGRIMVLPSRFESLPYIVLEAVAAQLPLVSTDVGGIGEIVPKETLIPANSPEALADALATILARPYESVKADATRQAQTIRSAFTVERMIECVENAYYDVIAQRRGPQAQG